MGLLHGDADIFDYELSVVRLALEHAPGDHTLRIVPLEGMTQQRILTTLETPNPRINVFFSGYSPVREDRFLQVDVPLTRGLLGYRLLVTPRKALKERAPLADIKDLRPFRIGSGIGWPDTRILSNNGLKVITSTYDNLWRMLEYGRFEFFHRGIQEVFTELARDNRQLLTVEPRIALVWRYDYFLYVSRERSELHDILTTGLLNAYRSGAFMDHFRQHPTIQKALRQARLTDRTLIRLALPDAFKSLNTIPDRFWHRPGEDG
ncbi:hypothetical protein C8D92_103213 [Tamilnaduibacter salinus]|uniref:Solute-binding protein family 3/N-terminal domain-containing protein n=1 Tax=Tamilnaduibacter salinus TaxID=1484056 RepID=A0A2U1CYF7_9GAMM|nr:hypothetical protein [Tamilnaduibacter salinus]PVY77526.1 hypothetical protein C8D92_103213 [Tamilnaduibacter salinus]